jgi:hypothetical protein
MLRTISYWGKMGHEAWALNVCALDKYLRAGGRHDHRHPAAGI